MTHTTMHLHLSLPDDFASSESESVAAFRAPEGSAETFTTQEDGGDGDGDSNTGSTIVSFLPLILIFAAVYFLLLRPRQRQMRRQRLLQSSLEVGDEIVMTSGVYGFITGLEQGSDVVWVEIDDDVQVRVSRAAISGKVDSSGAESSGASESGADSATGSTSRPTLKGGGRSSGQSAESSEHADE